MVDKSNPDGCWTWLGATNRRRNGFLVPVFRLSEGTINASRVAWMLLNGHLPDRLPVLHNCDNSLCVRPDHLRPGTQADNVADMVERGRSGRGAKNSQAVLTDQQVIELRRRRAAGERACDLARAFNLRPATCRNILRGQSYRYLPGGRKSGSVAA